MKTPHNKVGPAIALVLGLTAPLVQAAVFPDGAVLRIDSGVPSFNAYGYSTGIGSGSWFGMDQDKNSKIATAEMTALTAAGIGGVVIGSAQSASGSHDGGINGSESPAFDIWEFFGNTGMNYTRVAPTGDTTAGVDLSGWTVTWNAIPAIDMGTGAWTPANCGAAHMGCTGLNFSNGVANVSWDGTSGGRFSLWYTATVPIGDPSGFGGVQYLLRLTGTVALPGAVASTATLGSGTSGGSAANNYRATAALPADSGHNSASQTFDYTVNCGSAGCNADVFIPLNTSIPSGAVLRKFNPNTNAWGDFDTSVAPDAFATADSATGGGDCALATYGTANVLMEGHDCLRITQAEGGPNDTDTTASNGVYGDPVALAIPTVEAVAPDLSSGSSGCTLAPRPTSLGAAGDWLLLLAGIVSLGLYRRRTI